MDAQTITAQNEIVATYIRLADPRWEHILANIEVKQLEKELYVDALSFAIVKDGDEYKDASIPMNQGVMKAVNDLRQAMTRPLEASWNGFELTVDQPGTYKFTFSYDPPKRVEGQHDHQSYYRFNTYVADYAKRRAAETGSR